MWCLGKATGKRWPSGDLIGPSSSPPTATPALEVCHHHGRPPSSGPLSGRTGIDLKAYRLEPLRKALQMPQVGLFIADAVALGKTIEAGLTLQEMLLRQRIKPVVIRCRPSMLWWGRRR